MNMILMWINMPVVHQPEWLMHKIGQSKHVGVNPVHPVSLDLVSFRIQNISFSIRHSILKLSLVSFGVAVVVYYPEPASNALLVLPLVLQTISVFVYTLPMLFTIHEISEVYTFGVSQLTWNHKPLYLSHETVPFCWISLYTHIILPRFSICKLPRLFSLQSIFLKNHSFLLSLLRLHQTYFSLSPLDI